MTRHEVKQKFIKDIVKNYTNDEEGVWALDGKLEVRPAYQREFVYNDKQQEAVIETVMSGLPLNMFHFTKINEDRFQVLDGQQRLISICEFAAKKSRWHGKMYDQLSPDERRRFNNYKIDIYEYVFETKDELVSWFKTINIAGKELNEQEILNAGYTGPWLSSAKLSFSKGREPWAEKKSKGYVKAIANTQGYLTVGLKYISQKNNQTIQEYMEEHYEDENAEVLKNYFNRVMSWARKVHSPVSGLTDTPNWGKLYENYHDKYSDEELETITEQIDELMADEEISNHKGLIEYVLDGSNNFRLLSLRAFDKKLIAKKWAEQNGICPICEKKYDLKDMVGDHIIPWSRGGKTIPDNLQVLCKVCNSKKSDCYPVVEEEEEC